MLKEEDRLSKRSFYKYRVIFGFIDSHFTGIYDLKILHLATRVTGELKITRKDLIKRGCCR